MALVKNLVGRRPEIGKVKIGIKGSERQSAKGNTYRSPEKLDHFIVTGLDRDSHDDLAVDRDLMAELGTGAPTSKHPLLSGVPALKEIPIELFADDLDDVISQAYCWYPGKAIGARCDGETATYYTDAAGRRLATPIERPCNGEHEAAGWKLHTRFDFAIRSARARFGGIYSFRTTSRITAEQLVGSLVTLRTMACGALQGLPLVMVVRPMQVAPDGKPTTVYVVHVEARAESQRKLLQIVAENEEINTRFATRLTAAREQARRLLLPPGLESAEEQEEIAAEFHPEAFARDITTSRTVDAPVASQREPGSDDVADADAIVAKHLAAIAAAQTVADVNAVASAIAADKDRGLLDEARLMPLRMALTERKSAIRAGARSEVT